MLSRDCGQCSAHRVIHQRLSSSLRGTSLKRQNWDNRCPQKGSLTLLGSKGRWQSRCNTPDGRWTTSTSIHGLLPHSQKTCPEILQLISHTLANVLTNVDRGLLYVAGWLLTLCGLIRSFIRWEGTGSDYKPFLYYSCL